MARKRVIAVLVMISLVASSLFAVRGGWAASGSGQAGADEGSSFNTYLLVDFTDREYFALEGGVRLGTGEDGSWGFEGFAASVYSSPLQLLRHPFNFLFVNNTLWAPKLSAGIVTSREFDLYYTFSLSPLHLRETYFMYDILSPYVYFDSSFDYAGWGIELVRVSYFF